MKLQSALRLALAGLTVSLAACAGGDDDALATSSLVVTSHCELTGAGAVPGGDTFAGSVFDSAGTISGSWMHDGSVGEIIGTPSSLTCRLNGATFADITGSATVAGVAGYSFSLHVQDRGDPLHETRVPGDTETRVITATRIYSPSRWTDGVVNFAEGALVTVPAVLPVTVGNAGNQWARVTYVDHDTGDAVRCSYRGGASRSNPTTPADIALGLEYRWSRCERAGAGGTLVTDPAIVVGSLLDVDSIEVHVQHGSSRFPSCPDAETTVTLSLTVTPMVLRMGEPDYYRFLVFDAASNLVLFTDGDLVSGDLAVSTLP